MSLPWTAPSTGPRIDFSEHYDPAVLKDRSALVTGGATGIGRGCVEGLAGNGAYVTFCDVNDVEGKATEKELKDKGYAVQYLRTDVTSWEAVVAAFKSAVAFSPKKTVDIVIPNAGIAGGGLGFWLANPPVNSVTQDPLMPPRNVIDVNYLAVWNTVYAAMFYFKQFPGSQDDTHSKMIILVSSMGGYTPMPSVIEYNSTKWGVRGIFWSLRNLERILGEGKPNFRVNLIAPTWVKTNMTKRFQDVIVGQDSKVKLAEVSDCVDVVLRMSSDENVKGRAVAIAAEKKSFDICDESEGPGAAQVLNDPEYLKYFGYGPLAEAPKPQEAAPIKTNGVSEAPKVDDLAVKSVEVPTA